MILTKQLVMNFGPESGMHYRDLEFADGKSYVILGASGSGKSTLLNLLAGVLTPTSGSVFCNDQNMTALSQKEKDKFRVENIGYIFQDFKLIEEMSVEDNIRILELEKVDVSGIGEMLGKLGIGDKRKRRVSSLSGGEKQRVAIARALIKKPAIVLADEPTGNLNYEIGKEVVKMLTEAALGSTVIAVTHDERLAPLFDVRLDMTDILLKGADINENA